ncbi:MAG TPA: tetratricopeptide repeat protein, partial [Polyangia bacterium]
KAEARVHYERGLKLYERHQYDDAITELRAGLAVDPQPDILYALGQAERRRGNCERAIEYYQACLGLVKEPAAAAALRVQIERCKVESNEPKEEAAQLPAPTAEAPSATTPPSSSEAATPPSWTPPSWTPPSWTAPAGSAVAPAAPVATPSPPTRARWYRDSLGWALVGGGLAVGAGGGVLLGVAHARLDAAADSYQRYADARTAPAQWTSGVVTASLGGALVVVGVVRLAVVAARGRR